MADTSDYFIPERRHSIRTDTAPIATMAPQPWDDCLTRIKILEQEVADLKEFVHQLIDKLNVQELRRQRDERRQQGR